MNFYLGTHMPHWLELVDVPLFVSHRRLFKRREFPRAIGPWALDSGGFTELSTYGEWRTSVLDYARFCRIYTEEIGAPDFISPQDWMCEPMIIDKTRLSIGEHQERTVENYLELRSIAPDLPLIPVLQGWDPDDYLRCIDLYAARGIDLAREKRVGVGTVCRRQDTRAAEEIVDALVGLKLHGFGMKILGLRRYGEKLRSADSMAWSYRGRRADPSQRDGCTLVSCSNCLHFALSWRDRLISPNAALGPRLPL